MLPCDGGEERKKRNPRFTGGDDNEAIEIGDGGVAGEWGGLRGAGCGTGWAGGESGDDDGKESIDALRKKYGGGGFDACGEIQFQADAGDELVRACGDAHRAVELFSVREDFGTGGSGREARGYRWNWWPG